MNKEPGISVGILTDKKIKLTFFGDFRCNHAEGIFSGEFTAEPKNGEILLKSKNGESRSLPHAVVFTPSHPDTEYFTIRDVIIGVSFHWERKEKESFRGALQFLSSGAKVTAVNLIPLESYLTSVISSEMSAKCHPELLKAHSVISRSWALAQINNSTLKARHSHEDMGMIDTEDERIRWYDREDHTDFNFCADDHCQRYQGITKIHTESARQAVSDTAGIVLTYDNEVCDTRFSKSCGGISEAFEFAWENTPHPYLQAVTDYRYEPEGFAMPLTSEANAAEWILASPPAFCNTNEKAILEQVLLDYDQETKDFYRWKVRYTQQQLSALILERSGIDFGVIYDLIPLERGHSGRLIKLKIVGSLRTMIIGKELEIRKLLSKSHLYSSAFIVKKETGEDGTTAAFTLIGAGWGHGVGLCQIGAAVMAEKGYTFDEILLHYYRGASITKLY